MAAPAFKSIAETALRYLGVAPTVPVVAKVKPANKSEPKPAEVEPDGPGLDEPVALVASQEAGPDDGVLADEDDAEELGASGDSTSVVLPNFAGMGMGEAIRAARKAGIEMLPSGSGLAASQEPKPGTVPTGTVCRVFFERRGG